MGVVPSAYLTGGMLVALASLSSSSSLRTDAVLCLCVITVSSVPLTGVRGWTLTVLKVAAPAMIIFLLTGPHTATFNQWSEQSVASEAFLQMFSLAFLFPFAAQLAITVSAPTSQTASWVIVISSIFVLCRPFYFRAFVGVNVLSGVSADELDVFYYLVGVDFECFG